MILDGTASSRSVKQGEKTSLKRSSAELFLKVAVAASTENGTIPEAKEDNPATI
jgi:hypothetical protein